MKNVLRRLEIRASGMIDRFIMWSGYRIGCWRSVSRQLKILEDCSEKDLIAEVDILRNICCNTGLDTEYLKKIVCIRLSAAIIKYLKISGFDKEQITTDLEILRQMIQSWGEIEIDSDEYGYRYNGKSGCFWRIECDKNNKKRFQLFTIIKIRREELKMNQ